MNQFSGRTVPYRKIKITPLTQAEQVDHCYFMYAVRRTERQGARRMNMKVHNIGPKFTPGQAEQVGHYLPCAKGAPHRAAGRSKETPVSAETAAKCCMSGRASETE